MARAVSEWLTVRQIVELFVAMGCVPQEFLGTDVEPWADWQINFLRNPENDDCFIDLSGYALHQRIAPSVLESWERALGLEIPRGNNIN